MRYNYDVILTSNLEIIERKAVRDDECVLNMTLLCSAEFLVQNRSGANNYSVSIETTYDRYSIITDSNFSTIVGM